MEQTMDMDMGGTKMYVAANKTTNQTMQVSATKGDDGVDVQLTWGQNKK